MRQRLHRLAAMTAVLLLSSCGIAHQTARAGSVTIDFDTVPNLPLAPSTFGAARQDLTIPGVGTVVGGTPISNPTFLASFGPGGGARNAYGTESGTTRGYLQQLTVNFTSGNPVTNVTGTLFNGYPDLVSYTVSTFHGVNLLTSQTFLDVPDNSDPTGFRNFNLSGTVVLPIDRLVVTPDTTFTGGGWDYFIDNLTVTTTATATPEPTTILASLLGLAATVLGVRRRGRSRSAEAACGR